MVREDRINMSILENGATLNISSMDSGVIFDHDDNVSLSSMNTKGRTPWQVSHTTMVTLQ